MRLSGSYAAWGPARRDEHGRLCFEFEKDGRAHVVTMAWRGTIEDYPPR